MADKYSRERGSVSFQTGRTSIEFPAVDLIMIDEVSDEGAGLSLSTALPLAFGGRYS
jgi:hypothetical protein